jgi:hypothetical protein
MRPAGVARTAGPAGPAVAVTVSAEYDWPAAARFTFVVGHHCVREFQAEAGQRFAHDVVAVQDELGTPLDHRPRIAGYEFLRPHPATDPVACLQHDYLTAALG